MSAELAATGAVLGVLAVLAGVVLLVALLWGALFGLAAALVLGGAATTAFCLLAPVKPDKP